MNFWMIFLSLPPIYHRSAGITDAKKCVYVHVCASSCVCVCMHLYVSRRQRTTVNIVFRSHLPCFLRLGLSMALSSRLGSPCPQCLELCHVWLFLNVISGNHTQVPLCLNSIISTCFVQNLNTVSLGYSSLRVYNWNTSNIMLFCMQIYKIKTVFSLVFSVLNKSETYIVTCAIPFGHSFMLFNVRDL